jgi:hypothetical protein
MEAAKKETFNILKTVCLEDYKVDISSLEEKLIKSFEDVNLCLFFYF